MGFLNLLRLIQLIAIAYNELHEEGLKESQN